MTQKKGVSAPRPTLFNEDIFDPNEKASKSRAPSKEEAAARPGNRPLRIRREREVDEEEENE